MAIHEGENPDRDWLLQENARLTREARLATLRMGEILESISDAFFVLSPHWVFTYVNAQAENLLGRTRRELLDTGIWEQFPEARGSLFEKQYRLAVSTGQTVSFEDYYAPLNTWFQVKAFPSQSGLSVYFHDITHSKLAQEAVALSEERFRDLANSMPQIVWTAEPNGALDYTNLRWELYSGSNDPAQWLSFVADDDIERVVSTWMAAVVSVQTYETEFRLRSLDGSYRWHLVRALPTRNSAGGLKWFGTCTDIHEQKALAEQLRQARAEAEEANTTKSAFLANMSHEIRTPLAAILGFSEILQNPKVSADERQEYLAIILKNGRSLTQIIDDILDLSKVEAGMLVVEQIDFSPRQLLDEIAEILAEKARLKGLQFSVLAGPSIPPRLRSDPGRLRQILLNIVGNAVKFTQRGSVTLSAGAVALTPLEDQVRLEFLIADTGVGLSPDEQARLFQPFVQADLSTTREFGGTGLGLALSRRLAQALGGDVTIAESAAGQGSIFKIAVVATIPPLSYLAGEPKSVKGVPHLEGLRILVVDDAIDNRYLVERVLGTAGSLWNWPITGFRLLKWPRRGPTIWCSWTSRCR